MAKKEPTIAAETLTDQTVNAKHSNKKSHRRMLIVVGIVAVLLVVGITAYLLLRPQAQQTEAPYNPYKDQLSALQKEPIPKDPLDQAIYYSQLAQNLTGMKKFDDALQNYFRAQEIIDSNNLRGHIMFYLPVIEVYIAKKDNTKAKEYAQKAIDFYSGEYVKLRPEDKEGAAATVKALEAQRNSL